MIRPGITSVGTPLAHSVVHSVSTPSSPSGITLSVESSIFADMLPRFFLIARHFKTARIRHVEHGSGTATEGMAVRAPQPSAPPANDAAEAGGMFTSDSACGSTNVPALPREWMTPEQREHMIRGGKPWPDSREVPPQVRERSADGFLQAKLQWRPNVVSDSTMRCGVALAVWERTNPARRSASTTSVCPARMPDAPESAAPASTGVPAESSGSCPP